jgi:hypothetical protein
MNCKPGDLAIIINTDKNKDWGLGKIVKVLKPNPKFPNTHWLIECPPPYPAGVDPAKGFSIMDSCLKPVSGLPLKEEALLEDIIPNPFKNLTLEKS